MVQKVGLSLEFAQQHGPQVYNLYDKLYSAVVGRQTTGNQMREVLTEVSQHPVAPVILSIPMRESLGQRTRRDDPRDQIGAAAVSRVANARMVFDPVHHALTQEMNGLVQAGLEKPIMGIVGEKKFAGAGWASLKEQVSYVVVME